MKKFEKIALMALLFLAGLGLSGCAGDYDYINYGFEPICIQPPPYDPDVIIVADERPQPQPRPQPLPKTEVKPPTRTKEPERQPRTPAPRTPKPRPVGGKSPRNGQVRR